MITQRMALSPTQRLKLAIIENKRARMGSEKDDHLSRAFFFPSLQPLLYTKKASAAEEKENGLLRRTGSHRVLLRSFTPQL